MPKKERESASLYWLGTFNNYTEDELAILLTELDKCKMYAMQEEVGSVGSTPHLQLKIALEKKGRPTEHFTCKKIHWEKSRVWKGWQYCVKDDTNNGRRWGKGVEIPKPLIVDEMYGWQEDVLEIVDGEPDPRKIYWFWEPEGKFGKSALCRYLAIKKGALVVGGKATDMKAAIALMEKKPTICVMDVPRSVEHISYTGIEEIKNGIFFSSKYESGMVKMNFPHFIVLANCEPEMHKLSADRWVVRNIRQ